MLWPTNYQKLGSLSMFTMFFGGETFAPQLKHEGVSVQHFLQQKYCDAFAQLARQLPPVWAWECMNEPHNGLIGLPSLTEFDYGKCLHLGVYPNALQSMAAGAG